MCLEAHLLLGHRLRPHGKPLRRHALLPPLQSAAVGCCWAPERSSNEVTQEIALQQPQLARTVLAGIGSLPRPPGQAWACPSAARSHTSGLQ